MYTSASRGALSLGSISYTLRMASSAAISIFGAVVGGAVSAVIGGGLTAWAAIFVFKLTQKEIESSELRIQRTRCITALIGLRWVLASQFTGNPHLVEPKAAFNTELNKAIALWANDKAVVGKLRDFQAETNPERKMERLIQALRLAGPASSIDISALADVDLMNVVFGGL